MEEPPHYLMFILATTDVHKVPETIMSRCQIFNFKMIPLLENVERLKEICDAENIKWTKE
jgi:DNA polymerase-3 subunit gamma/tau